MQGLDTGADDDLTKPFSFAELAARLRALVYVRYLRQKIDRPFGVESIETVRGSGYRMRADGGRADA